MSNKNKTYKIDPEEQIIIDKVKYLDDFLKTEGLDISVILHESRKTINRFYEGKDKSNNSFLKRCAKYFKNVSYKDLSSPTITKDELPKPNELKIQQKTHKMRVLNEFLFKKEKINLGRALSISDKKLQNFLSGNDIPSTRLLRKTAHYFFLDAKYLLDDSVELPPLDKLIVDEDLASIQRDDIENVLIKNQGKHYISRNFQILGHKQRIQLVLSLLLVIIPLLAYTGYCAQTVLTDRFSTMSKYQDDSTQEFPVEDTKNMPSDECHTDVNIGSQLMYIGNVSASNSNYQVEMRLWFDFDQLSYHEMFYKKTYNQSIDKSAFSESNRALWYKDEWTYHTISGNFTHQPDNVPDIIELKDVNVTRIEDCVLNPLYLEEASMFPGITSSNVYPNNETMWIVGNGDMNADTHSVEMDKNYTLTDKSTGEVSFRKFQKCVFTATINKKFDNPRYPLDSVQFHIYILPMQLTTEYVRYVPVDSVDLTKNQTIANNNKVCSVDENVYETGVSPYFGISGGYKLITNSKYKGLVHRLSYYKDNNEQLLSRTEYEIVVRANRQGLSLFLQAFINLFSVVIWITIAFYNQAYNGEDSIGMLGTGLFGAISSILVGISMISDANMFSLITMVNIFTLAVIMMMTWESIASKRANISKDKVAIAYRGIKLRVLFIILAICILIMFIGLPLSSYIWELGL